MALVVQKFGGTSLADADRIRHVAERVTENHTAGNRVVVVVSAMGETTDELIGLAGNVSERAHPREMDMLLTAGERISMALVAMAIEDYGVPAVSFTGSQAGILTTSVHGKAEIVDITPFRVRDALDEGKVVIVAGFQGVSPDSKDVTTLGRGGSDATAVALAAALGANVCEIYTDVDGIFTADPRLVAAARKLDEISYEEMLEYAGAGAGVLMPRSVEYALRHDIPIHVRSSFHDGVGTWVKEETMEEPAVRGVAHDDAETKLTIHGVPDRPGVAAALFEEIAEAGVNVDMIIQNVSIDGFGDISFTVPTEAADAARKAAEGAAQAVGASSVDVDDDLAKISVVGAGMKTETGIAARVFRILSDAGINIEMISTSAIRVSCLVRAADAENAVRALHEGFVEVVS
ncbi:MAG: aspartate kinase [Acidobacteria bacterium]|nr:aspartate kinase [Acidobacteriota bacterium]